MKKSRLQQEKEEIKDANAAARMEIALSMHLASKTYREIAEACGYASASGAHNAVHAMLSRVKLGNVETDRKRMNLRLEVLLGALWPLCQEHEEVKVTTKNGKEVETREMKSANLFAVDRVLAILERQAKLLGLDKTEDEREVEGVVIREVPAGLLPLRIVESADNKAS